MHPSTHAHTYMDTLHTHARYISRHTIFSFHTKTECILQKLHESTKELVDCEQLVKIVDDALAAAHKSSDGLIKHLEKELPHDKAMPGIANSVPSKGKIVVHYMENINKYSHTAESHYGLFTYLILMYSCFHVPSPNGIILH